MAETAPAPNNRLIKFMGNPAVEKASALRKRGMISDRQADKRGLAPMSDERELASLKGRVASSQ